MELVDFERFKTFAKQSQEHTDIEIEGVGIFRLKDLDEPERSSFVDGWLITKDEALTAKRRMLLRAKAVCVAIVDESGKRFAAKLKDSETEDFAARLNARSCSKLVTTAMRYCGLSDDDVDIKKNASSLGETNGDTSISD